ncbi:MAG: hypothetical protein V1872_12405 [bacterium]
MDTVNLIKNKQFLGREFLTWLWFKSDTNSGVVNINDDKSVELWIDDKIVLESDELENNKEKVICHGEHSEMFEARQALNQGKKVSQANFKLNMNEEEWHFTLDDCWLNFRNCKPPKIILDKKEDPDGLFFEKTLLIEEATHTIDQLFSQFIQIRISPEWDHDHLPALQSWIQKGANRNEECF